MKIEALRLVAGIAIIILLASVIVTAQKQAKSWKEWSKKDAEKILSDSPWAHTQNDTDTSEMFYQPTADPRTAGARAPNSGARLEGGATNQETNVKYGIRFFSARPIRQAFVRMILLQRKPEPAVEERLNTFAEVPSQDSIIIAVTVESNDKRSLGRVMQIVNSAVTGTLKNTTYLERSDGKRLFLEEYVPPGADGFGARFIFTRKVDGMPFINADDGEIRFVTEYPASPVKLNMKFKVSEMMMDGRLEY
jgi:hypothetical protein